MVSLHVVSAVVFGGLGVGKVRERPDSAAGCAVLALLVADELGGSVVVSLVW